MLKNEEKLNKIYFEKIFFLKNNIKQSLKKS